MSQEPPANTQTVCCGQIRSTDDVKTVSSVNLYIGVINHLTSSSGAPTFGDPVSKLAHPGDIFDILRANNVLPANIYRAILNIQSLRSSLTLQSIKSSIVSVVDCSFFSPEPPFFDAAALLESINTQAASIAARHADLLAATNYLESLLSGENRILTFIHATARWIVCKGGQTELPGSRQCCARTLRNITQNKSIEVSLMTPFCCLIIN